MANTPAGWYPAPDASDLLRYWDGEMWTEQARPAPAGRGGPSAGHAGRPTLAVQKARIVSKTLAEGEVIEAGFMGTTPYRPMIFVATGARVLIFDPTGFRRRYQVHAYGYDQVTSIGSSAISGFTHITLDDGSTYKCSNIDTTAMGDFVSYVRTRLPRTGPIDLSSLPDPEGAGSTVAATSGKDDADDEATLGEQIREVAELHAEGILSDDEFAAAKAKLLGR